MGAQIGQINRLRLLLYVSVCLMIANGQAPLWLFWPKKKAATTTTANAFFGAQIRLIFCNFQLFCLARRRDVAALCANSAVIVGLGAGEGVRDGDGVICYRDDL